MIHSIKVGNTTEHISVYSHNQFWSVSLPGESSDEYLPTYYITDNRYNSNGITDPFTDHDHTSLVFNNDSHGTALQVAHIGETEIHGSSMVRIGAHTGVRMETGSGGYTRDINSHILVASSYDSYVKGINIDSTIIRGYSRQANYGMTLTDLNNEFSSVNESETWRIGTSYNSYSLTIKSVSDISLNSPFDIRLKSNNVTIGIADIGTTMCQSNDILFGRYATWFYGNYVNNAKASFFGVMNAYGYLSTTLSDYASTYFMVGNGTSKNKKNAIRITAGKFFAATAPLTAGAGVAEYFEWLDGNPDNEDRIGKFVTLEGEKIRFATPEDDYILGAIDPKPFAVGDIGDQWHGTYLKDVFGRVLTEKVFIPKEVDEEGNVLWEDHYEEVELVNPEFDPSLTFIDRQDRQEYDAITSKGKIVLIDDGTCQVNGYATVGENGIATRSDTNVAVRVMKRVDDTHIYVYIDHVFSPRNC